MIAIPNMEKPKRCELCPCSYYSEGALSDICQITNEPIDGTPTDCPLIDIIPCKECKNSHMTYDGKCKYCDLERDDDDNFIECYFDGDHFCSYGERRSDDKTEESRP